MVRIRAWGSHLMEGRILLGFRCERQWKLWFGYQGQQWKLHFVCFSRQGQQTLHLDLRGLLHFQLQCIWIWHCHSFSHCFRPMCLHWLGWKQCFQAGHWGHQGWAQYWCLWGLVEQLGLDHRVSFFRCYIGCKALPLLFVVVGCQALHNKHLFEHLQYIIQEVGNCTHAVAAPGIFPRCSLDTWFSHQIFVHNSRKRINNKL